MTLAICEEAEKMFGAGHENNDLKLYILFYIVAPIGGDAELRSILILYILLYLLKVNTPNNTFPPMKLALSSDPIVNIREVFGIHNLRVNNECRNSVEI